MAVRLDESQEVAVEAPVTWEHRCESGKSRCTAIAPRYLKLVERLQAEITKHAVGNGTGEGEGCDCSGPRECLLAIIQLNRRVEGMRRGYRPTMRNA